MNFIMDAVKLDIETRVSGKTGNSYAIAKFAVKVDGKNEVLEFFVAGTKTDLIANVAKVTEFSPCKLNCRIKVFKGKAEIELDGIKA